MVPEHRCFEWSGERLRIQWRRPPPKQARFTGAVASGDGRLIAVGHEGQLDFFDGTSLAWLGELGPSQVDAPHELSTPDRTACGYGAPLALSADGRWLATNASESRVQIWDLKYGRLLRTFRGAAASGAGAILDEQALVVQDGQRIVYAPAGPPTLDTRFPGLRLVSSDGRHGLSSHRAAQPPPAADVAEASGGPTIRTTNLLLNMGDQSALALDASPVAVAQFSRDGRYLAVQHTCDTRSADDTCARGDELVVWDVGAMEPRLRVPARALHLVFGVDGTRLYWLERERTDAEVTPTRAREAPHELLHLVDLADGARSQVRLPAASATGVTPTLALLPHPEGGVTRVLADGAMQRMVAGDAGLLEALRQPPPLAPTRPAGRLRMSEDLRLAVLERGQAGPGSRQPSPPALGLSLGPALELHRLPFEGTPPAVMERFAKLRLPALRHVPRPGEEVTPDRRGTGITMEEMFGTGALWDIALWNADAQRVRIERLPDIGDGYAMVRAPSGSAVAVTATVTRSTGRGSPRKACADRAALDRTGPLLVWNDAMEKVLGRTGFVPFSLAISPDAARQVSQDCDGVSYRPVVTSAEQGARLFVAEGVRPVQVQFTPDGHRVAVMDFLRDGRDWLRVYRLDGVLPELVFSDLGRWTGRTRHAQLRFSDDGKLLGIGGAERSWVLELETLARRALTVPPGPGTFTLQRVTNDGRAVGAQVGGGNSLWVWGPTGEAPELELEASWPSHMHLGGNPPTLTYVDRDAIHLVRLSDGARLKLRLFEDEERSGLLAEVRGGKDAPVGAVFAASPALRAQRVHTKGGIVGGRVLTPEEVEGRLHRPGLIEALRAGEAIDDP